MSIRRILARVDGTDGDHAVLAVALEVARVFGAHIDAVHVKFDTADLPLVTGYGPVGDLSMLADSLQRTASESLARARRHFEDWRVAGNIPVMASRIEGDAASVMWMELEEREPDAIARLGRLVDLIVVGQPNEQNGFAPLTALETAVFQTRHPVLMVPPSTTSATSAGLLHRPMVAWNGSSEASLAVMLSLPFLRRANGVVGIFTAAEGRQSGRAEDLVTYLEWHSVNAEPVSAIGMQDSVGENLLWEAEARGSGMIVMGAYSHGRVRQFLFGGVTTHVFRHAKMPVLLAH